MKSILWILFFMLPALWSLRKDFQRGLVVSLALFAFVTNGLVVEGGPSAFELTYQRVLLGVVVLGWLVWFPKNKPLGEVPYLKWAFAMWAVNLVALMFAVDKMLSLKSFITFSSEVLLFYVIVATTLKDGDTALKAYRALCVSATIIAVLGVIEYYWFFNFAIDWMGVAQPKDETDVLVMFKHRILFGYSMAMGWPLLLAEAQLAETRKNALILIGLAMLVLSACYFSGSRGPWFGSAGAGIIMFLLGSGKVRKCMKVFALLSVVVVIARPGVRATLVDLVTSTFDTEAYRGKSYAYRKMLWPVAMELAASSPVRFLFGHGGLSTETMDLSDKFDGVGGSTYHTGFSSWDNHYAADLVEFGYVGLLLQWVMFGYILFKIGRAAYRSPPETRDRNAAVVAALAVFMFSLTNVYMFSPQLKCMFWTLIVIGTRFTSAEWEDKMTGAEEQSSEEAEPVDENQGYAATV